MQDVCFHPPPGETPLPKPEELATHPSLSIVRDIGMSSAARDLANFEDRPSAPGAASSPSDPLQALGGGRARGDGGAAALSRVIQERGAYKGIARNEEELLAKSKEITARAELARQMTRKWNDGDVYAPHDLSEVEMMKWKQPKRPTKDIIDMLGLNPLDHYKVRWWRCW